MSRPRLQFAFGTQCATVNRSGISQHRTPTSSVVGQVFNNNEYFHVNRLLDPFENQKKINISRTKFQMLPKDIYSQTVTRRSPSDHPQPWAVLDGLMKNDSPCCLLTMMASIAGEKWNRERPG